jgi:hypothetical protein
VRFIPTLVHGIADYLVGVIVIGLPFFFGIESAPRLALIALGTSVLLYSLLTDYELGAIRFLRVRFHLLLDGVFGVVMLLLPSLFSIAPEGKWPIYLIGLLALALTFTTEIRAVGTAATK